MATPSHTVHIPHDSDRQLRKRDGSKRAITTRNVGKTFVLFPKLPIELQFLIWNSAIDSVRVPGIVRFDWFHRPKKVAYPGLLHACRDSRAEFLRRYSMNLRTTFDRRHWVDTENEIVLFIRSRYIPDFDEGIKHVAICVDDQEILLPTPPDDLSYPAWVFHDGNAELQNMSHLESFFLVRKNLNGLGPEVFRQKIADDIEDYIEEVKDEKFTQFVRKVKPRFITYDQLCLDWK